MRSGKPSRARRRQYAMAVRAARTAMGVYQVRESRARLTAVRLGGRNDAEAWVQAGLQHGAQVIVYPPAQLRDGERVRVRAVAQPR